MFTAEGTRFSQAKHEASVKFAEGRNMVPLKHHLIPRPKGFVTCVPLLQKHKCPSILNMQLSIDKNSDVIKKLFSFFLRLFLSNVFFLVILGETHFGKYYASKESYLSYLY